MNESKMTASELTGLPLRKLACEALGWKLDTEGWWHEPGCRNPVNFDGCPCGATSDVESLPAIESDPAVAIPILMEFCDKNGWEWHLCKVDGVYNCWIEDITKDDFPEADGDNPSEARARAIVTASWKEGK